ncbi:flagellar hook-length control protein FliK [Terricaulis sp.]|uniref:flagellar hook-length control protein FliK n=1 Tax=Terricaulis sp. TaxID=2768686 RepID=UPI0037847D23
MGFAATAIADVVQPPRTERASAPERDDGPSFAEHLESGDDTAAAERPRAERPAAERPRRADDEQEQQDEAVEAAAPPTIPQPETPPAPPLMAQLIAQLKAAPAEDAKPAQTPDTTAPVQAPLQGDLESAPQAAPLSGVAGQAQQDAAEQGAEIAPLAAYPLLKAKNAAKTSTQQTQSAAQGEAQLQAVQHLQAPAETAAAPVQAATDPEVQRAAPDVAVKLDAPRTPRAQPPQPEARTPEAPAQTDAQKNATPLQQALAALRDGAKAANTGEKNTEIKIAAPAQHAAPQSAAAVAPAPLPSSQVTAEHAAQRIAPASTQVAREIVRRFNGGATSFELRLDPPELGRIDVRMEVSRDHKVTAVIAADSPQALSDLMRHARDLEASLQSAGLDLAENGLSFDLNQSGQRSADEGDGGGRNARQAAAQTDDPAPAPAARPLGLESWRGVRIDVMA